MLEEDSQKLQEKKNLLSNYLALRAEKYKGLAEDLNLKRKPIFFLEKTYFRNWLSGFIEAEGCFSARNAGTFSFAIGQNHEYFLLESLRTFFKIKAKICLKKKEPGFFMLETFNKESLLLIIQHLQLYPLLGEKAVQFEKFLQKFILFHNKKK